MSVLTAEERAAAKWLRKHGVEVAEPTTLLTIRLSVRCGKSSPTAFIAVFVLSMVLFGYLFLLSGADRGDPPLAVYVCYGGGAALLTTWFRIRAGDRRLYARSADRPRPPWREVVNDWYTASLLITFGGGAALGIVLGSSGWSWAGDWLGVLTIGAVADAVILAGVVRRPVIAEDEGSLAVDTVTRLEDVNLTAPSLFAAPIVVDLVLEHPPGGPWPIVYVALAVLTHAAGWFTQRRRVPALPADGHYGEPR